MKPVLKPKKRKLILCLITAAFLCVACKGPGSGDKPADISMAPSGVSQPSGNPAQPSTPTPTSTPSPTPTMTPSPTPTPTPIPEEQFVELGNRKNGNTMRVGTYQYNVDMSGIHIDDLEDFKSQLRELPNLLYLEMIGCGLNNKQMEELTEEFPSIRFVWRIYMHETRKVKKETPTPDAGNGGEGNTDGGGTTDGAAREPDREMVSGPGLRHRTRGLVLRELRHPDREEGPLLQGMRAAVCEYLIRHLTVTPSPRGKALRAAAADGPAHTTRGLRLMGM